MKTEPIFTRCNINCSAELADTDIELSEGRLKRCTACGQLLSQCSRQDYSETMEEFNHASGTWPPPENLKSLERSTQKTVKNIVRLSGRKRTELKLLDVGCSNGAFIHVAGQMGVNCHGVEPAENAAAAAQKIGLKVHNGYLEDLDPGKKYDVITMFEVIEHVEQPVDLLIECRKRLNKNGLLVIRTANTNSWTVTCLKGHWHYFSIKKHGGHISFFCRESMRTLAEKAMFRIDKYITHSVSLCDEESSSLIKYRALKFVSELLNLPAKLSGNGQEMEIYMRKS